MSLHTKYRPNSFESVLGQEKTVASLKRVVKDARAKAFIFDGPSGTGKTTLARILANIFAGGAATQANLEEVDAASNSGADDMRAVISRSMYRAVGVSPVKSIIIDEAHRLSAAAWTILLKPVEEPPKHVYWMFCTTELGKIPKTILTRCLRYDLKPVNEENIYELLATVCGEEHLETPEEVLETIAENSGGSPRQALVFLEACAACSTASAAQQIMRSAGQSKETIDLCRFLLSGRGRNWAEAVKYVKALEGHDAEGIRIAIVNYLGAALLGAKSDDKARELLGLLEPFLGTYNTSDRLAPLLRSLGLALNLDQ